MMGDTLPRQMTNSSEKKKQQQSRSNFDFCKVCNLNHDQGQKHKYFPSHKKSLSSYLSRFQSKVGDVLFFLKNPSVLRPELALRNRFWCIFCDVDVVELKSCFACENAINHLSSGHHLSHLKQFAWKYGGVMDHLDKYRISDDDVTKWKKKCKALNKEAEASEEVSNGPLAGGSHDIHNKPIFGILVHFGNNVNAVNSSNLNDVMPLQYCTNEYQTHLPANVGIAEVGTLASNQTSHVLMEGFRLTNHDSDSLTGSRTIQHHVHSRSMSVFMDGVVTNQERHFCQILNEYANFEDLPSFLRISQVYKDNGVVTPENRYSGGQYLTRVSSLVKEEAQGNVHSGAAPPWLDSSEQSQFDSIQRPSASFVYLHKNSGNSRKLNPKRVGAAWAEKRKMELELERKGETVKSYYDADWLPDFGRVWQSGTRRASRKEFEMEKEQIPNGETQSEMPTEIKPYASKRMRKDVSG